MRTTEWRKALNAELRNLKLNPGSVLSVGAHQGSHDWQGHRYRDYFRKSKFYTCDPSIGKTNEFHVRGSVEEMHGEFDLVLIMNVLEHSTLPYKTASAAAGLVKPGGHLFVSAPFFYRIHTSGGMRDYWRFTAESLDLLFYPMKRVWCRPFGKLPCPVGFFALYRQ
jgi:SAM-dependent methyltransferase